MNTVTVFMWFFSFLAVTLTHFLSFTAGPYRGGEFALPERGAVWLGTSGEMTLRLATDMSLLDVRLAWIDVMGEGDCMIMTVEAGGDVLVNDRTLQGALPLLHRSRVAVGEHRMMYMAGGETAPFDLSESRARRRKRYTPSDDSDGMLRAIQRRMSIQSDRSPPRSGPPVRRMGRVGPGANIGPNRVVYDTSTRKFEEILEQIASRRHRCVLCYGPHDSVAICLEDGIVRGVSYQDERDPRVAFARILALGPAVWHVDMGWSEDALSSLVPVDRPLDAFIQSVIELLRARAAARSCTFEEE